MQLLWKTELPPTITQLADFEICGDYAAATEQPTPYETLLLGITEDDLAKVEGIAFDPLSGGIEAQFTGGLKRSIGPLLRGAKEFSIDGAGGERIVSVCPINYAYSGTSIRMQTNRGRQLMVYYPWMGFAELPPELPSRLVAGFCAKWDLHMKPQVLSPLSVATENTYSLPENIVDDIGHYWEPSLPPSDWIGSESIFPQSRSGKRAAAQIEASLTAYTSIVSWLDCRKSIK